MFTPTFVSYLVISILTLLPSISKSEDSKRSTRIKYTPLSQPGLRLDRYIINDERKWVRVGSNSGKGNDYSFDEDFFSKNGSDYTIVEDVIGVMIVCEAKYPIEIVFPSIEQVASSKAQLLMTPERVSEFNEDLDEPLTQSYLLFSFIIFENIKFFSSTLECQSVEKKEISSSMHLYKLSSDEIDRKGETIQVTLDPNQKPPQVELPCRPASPGASILLQKQVQVSFWKNGKLSNNTFWKEYHRSTKFNPKTGITLTLPASQVYYTPNPDELIGLYKCTLKEGNEDDYVLVNVSRKLEQGKDVFYPKFKLKGKASFGLLSEKDDDERFYEKYKCCSGVPSKPPSFFVKNCDSLFECNVELARLDYNILQSKRSAWIQSLTARFNHSSDCSTNILYGVSSIVLCTGENIDVSQQYFQMLRTPDNHGNGSLIKQDFYVPHSLEWNAKVEKRIVISIGKSEGESPKGYSTSEDDVNSETFIKRRHHFDERISFSDVQTIFQVNSDVYEGESIFFMCFGLYLFHAEGGYIKINWKNGTKTVLQDSGHEVTRVEFNHNSKYFTDAVTVNPIFGKPIEASRDMISVECFQPVWNETRWDKLEMPLEVKASVEPVFSGSPEEIVYFNLNEKECAITFQLSQGTPVPHTIGVTKDGKSLGVMDDDKNLSNTTENILFNFGEGIVTIKFPTVSYEIHGTYQCTAENIKGEAVKTIRVIVKEKSSAVLTAFLICIGLMTGILCLGLGLRFWIRKTFFHNH